MKNIAIFASGTGSNAEQIMRYFSGSTAVNVAFVLTNKADALVLEKAKQAGKPGIYMSRDQFNDGESVMQLLADHQVDLIVLAGFLLFIPEFIISQYSEKIVNIHPSLLPKYGGKGMYGLRVHEAVLAAGETESGITIHDVNLIYDSGRVLFQATCPVDADDTPETLAQRVHALEHAHYPEVIEQILLEK